MKSHSSTGTIMTRCMIRKEFFHQSTYKITLKNPKDIAESANGAAGSDNKTLIEFCLPFLELRHIIDTMVEDENSIHLEYPHGDNMLQVLIPEESKGSADKVQMTTSLQLDTYALGCIGVNYIGHFEMRKYLFTQGIKFN